MFCVLGNERNVDPGLLRERSGLLVYLMCLQRTHVSNYLYRVIGYNGFII